MLSRCAGTIIIIIIIIVLNQSHVLPSPAPKSVFKTCYDNNRLCFETDLTPNLEPSTFALGPEKLCPPGKTLPQVFGEVEQKALQEYLATLPRNVKYQAPLGLKIKYRQWTEVIKANSDILSDKHYLTIKLNKDSLLLQAQDDDAKLPFGCVIKAPCPCQTSRTKDSLCLPLDTCCLQIDNNNKLNYYDAVNYCKTQNNASLLTYSLLSNNQKILTSLPANVQELWAGETRVALTWLNNDPAIYTHWHPGYPKDKAVFAYLKHDDKDGGWMTFQDGDLSSSYDGDAYEKYIAVCVGEEKPNGMEKPTVKTGQEPNGMEKPTVKTGQDTSNNNNNNKNNNNDNNNNDNDANNIKLDPMKLLKIGLGVGLSLCLLLVLVLVTVLVVCLHYRKRRRSGLQGQLGKTPSVGTVSSSASSRDSRRSGSHLSENGYNNYVTRDNFSNNNNDTRIIPADNYGTGHSGGRPVPPLNNQIYEDIRPYEIPDDTPIVEHIYKAIRNPPVEYQRQLPQLPPERPATLPQAPQTQYLPMRRNSYLEVIA